MEQYYRVDYVADGDVEEYNELELSEIVYNSDSGDAVDDGIEQPLEGKYGIGTPVGKYFDLYGKDKKRQCVFFFGVITSYDASEACYNILYEDDDEEVVDEIDIEDMILAAHDHSAGKKSKTKKKIQPHPKKKIQSRPSMKVNRSAKPDAVVSSSISISDTSTNSKHMDLCLFANHGLITTDSIEASLKKMTYILPKDRQNVADFFLFMSERHKLFIHRKYSKLSQLNLHFGTSLSITGLSSPPPPIQNLALREYVFCNMYRELDRGTQFIRRYLLRQLFSPSDPLGGSVPMNEKASLVQSDQEMMTSHGVPTSKESESLLQQPHYTRREWTLQMLWTFYIYRQVGRMETFVTLDFPKIQFDCSSSDGTSTDMRTLNEQNKEIVASHVSDLRQMMSQGISVFTGSYQTAPLRMYEAFLRKSIANGCELLNHVGDVIMEYYSGDCDANDIDFFEYHKNCCDALTSLPGIGIFFGWQLFSDLEEAGCIPSHPSSNISTLMESFPPPREVGQDEDEEQLQSPPYIVLGPGARKGLNVIFGPREKQSYTELLQRMHVLIRHQFHIYDALGVNFNYWNHQSLSGKVIE
jgi:hypothetical protein